MTVRTPHEEAEVVATSISADVLTLDPTRAVDEITGHIRHSLQAVLKKRGVVVAMSGGIDSSVVAALCVRAFVAGPRVRAAAA